MRWTRSACICLKLNLARSPERVLMPLRGCFGTLSTGNAQMNCVLFHRLSEIRKVGPGCLFLVDSPALSFALFSLAGVLRRSVDQESRRFPGVLRFVFVSAQ